MLDEKKISELYTSLGRELLVYIFRLTGSMETAEDLLHDAFVNLMDYSGKREVDTESVRAFLYRTAHNLCVNHLKRSSLIEASSLNDWSRAGQDTADEAEKAQLNKKITSLLEGMDPVHRSVFVMRKELGMSPHEIAGKLGISERSVQRKLAKALKLLCFGLKKSGWDEFFYVLFIALLCNIMRGLGA